MSTGAKNRERPLQRRDFPQAIPWAHSLFRHALAPLLERTFWSPSGFNSKRARLGFGDDLRTLIPVQPNERSTGFQDARLEVTFRQ